MSCVTVRDGALHIELTVPERVLSLHGASIVVPLAHVTGVRIVRDILAHLRGLRMPGAGIPGVLAIGAWRGILDGRKFHDFVVIHRAGPGIVLNTSGEYDRILLGNDEPDALAFDLGLASRPPV